MVKVDPTKVRSTLPDAFLLAIGKVCVQWSMLESTVEMVTLKLTGMNDNDVRGKIMVNHMSWPQRMDVLGALVDALIPDYPKLSGFDEEVAPLLKKAQDGRNRIIHGHWAREGEKVIMLRATARKKLKIHMDEITLEDINNVIHDIHDAMAALWNKVIGT